jgi:hypothetical protein
MVLRERRLGQWLTLRWEKIHTLGQGSTISLRCLSAVPVGRASSPPGLWMHCRDCKYLPPATTRTNSWNHVFGDPDPVVKRQGSCRSFPLPGCSPFQTGPRPCASDAEIDAPFPLVISHSLVSTMPIFSSPPHLKPSGSRSLLSPHGANSLQTRSFCLVDTRAYTQVDHLHWGVKQTNSTAATAPPSPVPLS